MSTTLPRRAAPVPGRGVAAVSALLVLAAWLGGCASPPPRPAPAARPAAKPAPVAPGRPASAEAPPPAATRPAEPAPSVAEIERMPEPEPRVEPIREGGPNKPYVVGGETIVPMVRDIPYRQRGMASWYGRPFHGRRTANGEVFNMYGFSAAHRTLPLPSYARVRNPANGREVVLRINDRGPFARNRVLDLSYAAAVKLGLVQRGHGEVEIEHLSADAIRTGAWRRGSATDVADAGKAGAARPSAPAPAPAAAPAAEPAALPAASLASAAAGDPSASAALPAGVVAVSTAAEPGTAAAPAEAAASAPAVQERVQPAQRAAGGYWLQLGAFRDLAGASSFQERVQAQADWLAPQLSLLKDGTLIRLQAGPFTSRAEAGEQADRVRRDLQLVPLVVQRR